MKHLQKRFVKKLLTCKIHVLDYLNCRFCNLFFSFTQLKSYFNYHFDVKLEKKKKTYNKTTEAHTDIMHLLGPATCDS